MLVSEMGDAGEEQRPLGLQNALFSSSTSLRIRSLEELQGKLGNGGAHDSIQ